MGCPEKSKIEQLVAGALGEDDTQDLLSHLAGCLDCRQEAAFLTAVRLSMPSISPGPQCLSDESLSLLRDDLLEDQDREKALSHLGGCHHCLGAWLSLDRSLEEADREPVRAPAHLLKKAVALGARGKQTEKIPFLQRLLGPSPVWRLGLAGAAAAVVLVLAVVLSAPPTQYERPEPSVLVSELLDYVDLQRPINVDDVEQCTPYRGQSSIFALVDAIGQRQGEEALRKLHEVLMEDDASYAFAMILRQFRLIIRARDMIDSAKTPDHTVHRSKFVVKKVAAQARNFSLSDLENIYRELLEIDLRAKNGQMDLDVALDRLVSVIAA